MTASIRDRLREILRDNDCDEHPLSDADYAIVIDAILAVFAEGERDRERLDWLESQTAIVLTKLPVTKHLPWYWERSKLDLGYSQTFRTALDAAKEDR